MQASTQTVQKEQKMTGLEPILAAVISGVSMTNGLYNTYRKLQVESKFREKEFNYLSRDSNDTRRSSDYKGIVDALNIAHTATMSGKEKVMTGVMCDVYTYLRGLNERIWINIEMTLIVTSSSREYERTSDVRVFRMDTNQNPNIAATCVEAFIRDVRYINNRRNKLASNKAKRCVIIISVNYRFIDRLEIDVTDKNLMSALAMIGQVLAECFNQDYDGNFIKAGVGDNKKISMNRNINVLIEAIWRKPEAGTVTMAMDVQSVITGDKGINDALIRIKDMVTNNGERNILLIGQSGSGKSRTANLIVKCLSRGMSKGSFQESQ